MLQVIYHGVPLAGIAASFAALPGKARTEVLRGLGEGGLRVRTMVRRSLREQTNVARAAAVNRRTTSYLNAAELSYHIAGANEPLPIDEFNTRIVSGRVWSNQWGVGRIFARSYQQKTTGALRARRTSARYPVRRLLGPNLAKELVKDKTLHTFENAGGTVILPIISRRLAKLAAF